MRTEDMYGKTLKTNEIQEKARILRRKFLRYQQAMIVYSLSHKYLEQFHEVSGVNYEEERIMGMTRKVWLFSHLVDDEDLEFMQHEFVSYSQAMEYYGLGYKPIVRLSHKSGSVYKIGKKVLIKRSIFEQYLRDHIKREKASWEE